MRYTRVIVHFTNGKSAEFSNVMEQPSPDEEYRFEGIHYTTRYSVMKRNVNYIERVK
ncbi:hypothetical protein SEA_MOAB_236 [Streptomyces phage Moab]|nr:hypothetical protein SEA_MOAB_236 [Streptomyces phage Moab]WMI33839.1 hypothetical protein SEA_PATELGO_237 [Streptomyces phage Patelgo]